MEISLGPAPLSWGKERVIRFYEEMAETEVAHFYLGEIFCPKRGRLFREDLVKIADLLRRKGKRTYVSSYAIIRHQEELEELAYLLKATDGIEINNVAVLEMVLEGKDLVAGPFLNVYNSRSAGYLRRLGMKRIVIPSELGWKEASEMVGAVDAQFEYLVSGNLSLGVFPGCYTARALGLDERACEKACLRHPEGMVLKALSGEMLFNLNGPEVSSAKIHSVTDDLRNMEGLSSVRIRPQARGTREVVARCRSAMDGQAEEGRESVESVFP
ncbi:MAG: U32 family peptidase [Candidatus Latescibacterota bacterium]